MLDFFLTFFLSFGKDTEREPQCIVSVFWGRPYEYNIPMTFILEKRISQKPVRISKYNIKKGRKTEFPVKRILIYSSLTQHAGRSNSWIWKSTPLCNVPCSYLTDRTIQTILLYPQPSIPHHSFGPSSKIGPNSPKSNPTAPSFPPNHAISQFVIYGTSKYAFRWK